MILLLHPSFTKKETFKIYGIFSTICKYAPNVFNALYCKFRLVRLCSVFADPVTNWLGNHKARALFGTLSLQLFSLPPKCLGYCPLLREIIVSLLTKIY